MGKIRARFEQRRKKKKEMRKGEGINERDIFQIRAMNDGWVYKKAKMINEFEDFLKSYLTII